MEESTSRVDILKCLENMEEIIFNRDINFIKSNSFPLRIRKEHNLRVFTQTRKNSLHNNCNFEIAGCENIHDGDEIYPEKIPEDVVNEGEFTEKLNNTNDFVFRNSISSPNLGIAKNNGVKIYAAAKSASNKYKETFHPLLGAAESSNVQSNMIEEPSGIVLNVSELDDSSLERESYSMVSNHISNGLNASPQERITIDTPSIHPLRPCRSSRRCSSHRSETQPTQIQIEPLSRSLSSHVEEALGIFSQLKTYQPTIGSAIFSVLMTIIFVGILWIVVFTIFGTKGHAIAGIFLSIFILGFLLNTCFLKFYFRLRLFFGMEHLREQTLMARNIANLEQQREDEIRQQRAMEPPPSYSSIMEAPPPYNIAKTMKPQIAEDSNIKQTMDVCRNCIINESMSTKLCAACKENVITAQK